METNNPMLFKLGEGMAGKFNLGGGVGGAETGREGVLSQSTNAPLGGLGAFRASTAVG